MPPPKDRLAAMQQNADIQPGDDCEVGMEEQGAMKDFFKEMEEIKANVEKLLKFHSDFKVKHDALVRAGVAAATKFSRINLIQL